MRCRFCLFWLQDVPRQAGLEAVLRGKGLAEQRLKYPAISRRGDLTKQALIHRPWSNPQWTYRKNTLFFPTRPLTIKQDNHQLAAENRSLKEKVTSLEAELKQAKKELAEANGLLVDMRVELNNWKNNILGFRDEIRQADSEQIKALLEILKILGGEIKPDPNQGSTQHQKDLVSRTNQWMSRKNPYRENKMKKLKITFCGFVIAVLSGSLVLLTGGCSDFCKSSDEANCYYINHEQKNFVDRQGRCYRA